MYDNGEGVRQDKSEAVRWYRKAAEQGNANAQCNLGMAYQSGEGVRQDYEEARKWYRRAIEGGNEHAQTFLEHMEALVGLEASIKELEELLEGSQ